MGCGEGVFGWIVLFGACVCVEVAERVAGFIENIFDVVFVCWQGKMRGDVRVPGPGFALVVWFGERCGGAGGTEGNRVVGRRKCSGERWWVPEPTLATV